MKKDEGNQEVSSDVTDWFYYVFRSLSFLVFIVE
jgi:hypothetical protein